jgi:hypothetical protein
VIGIDPRSFWGLRRKLQLALDRAPTALRYRKDRTEVAAAAAR